MKIYDCFMFFKEFEVLEMRFRELDQYVDFFVLTESDKTHALKPKPLYFKENNSAFEKYRNKIIYIENVDNNSYSGVWSKENADRNTLKRGYSNAASSDLIMISDVDEIPDFRYLDVSQIVNPVTLDMDYFYYYVNYQKNRLWPGTTVFKNAGSKDPQWYRDNRTHLPRIRSGWHYSYLGGFERVKEKLIHNPDSIEYRHFDYVNEKSDGSLIKKRIDSAEDIFGRGGDQSLSKVSTYEGRKPDCLRDIVAKYPYLENVG